MYDFIINLHFSLTSHKNHWMTPLFHIVESLDTFTQKSPLISKRARKFPFLHLLFYDFHLSISPRFRKTSSTFAVSIGLVA